MLTRVEAYSQWASAPILTLDDNGREDTDLFHLRNIDGLGPVKATVNTSPFGSIDGVSYIGSDIAERNPVLTIHPNPDWVNWSVEKLRRALYAYFTPKQIIKLLFFSDDIPPVEISGIVEDCAPNIFASDPEYTISIICPDPYFTAINPTVVSGQTGSGSMLIEYNGSIPCGFYLTLNRVSDPAPANITVQAVGQTLNSFKVAGSVSASTYFVMNSVPGNKYARSVNTSTSAFTNLLSKMQDGSTWPNLEPGKNQFSVITDGGVQSWMLTYYERYGGL